MKTQIVRLTTLRISLLFIPDPSYFCSQLTKMDIVSRIKKIAQDVIQENYQLLIDESQILVNETKPEFEGNYTVVLFSFVKNLKKSPEALGRELGEFFLNNFPDLFSSFNVIKGFLNLTITDATWTDFLNQH